jgi:hypothetical protein
MSFVRVFSLMRAFSLRGWLRILNKYENRLLRQGKSPEGLAMKNLMVSMLAIGLASSFVGCAIESDAPDENTVSSDVTVGTWNFVRSCTPLALRTCDNPGACDTGVRLALHSQVFVIGFDSGTKMAHLSSPSGWALADGASGEVYLSKLDGSCN